MFINDLFSVFTFYNSMILTIDIGNSSTKFGVFDGEKLTNKITIPTVRETSSDSIYSQIKDQTSSEFSAIIISSVVSELYLTYQELGENIFNVKPFFADHTFDYGYSLDYFPPENCGSDRLVGAFAGVEKYGTPVIVCDFGTATTIDAVNSDNEFLGGIIAPGMNILADALFQKTSKLPKVEIKKPESVFGNTTIISIQSGIFYGYIGLVDGILLKMIDELDENAKIIATGGLASIIAEESQLIEIIDDKLMLDGLRLVYKFLKQFT